MSTQDYLFELGCEELPPTELPKLAESLRQNLSAGLKKSRLTNSGLEVFCTPRRLAVLVRGLITRQPDLQQERRGPALDAAYNESGKPTAALLGFSRSVGVEPEQLEQRQTDKGTWLYAQVSESGQPVEALLPDLIKTALSALPIGKKMRWGMPVNEFVRPVRWMVSLLGNKVLPLQLFSLEVGQSTRGHRVHCPKPLTIPSAAKYLDTLKNKGFVLADFSERRQLIEKEIARVAAQVKCHPVYSKELLDELTCICEWPVAIYGRFDGQFLKLPQEVLIVSMQKHQKYIALREQKDGPLHNGFITVANLESKNLAAVVAGNERVIRPRLADAQFFFHADQKRSLSNMAEQLDQVLYQVKLGTLAQRSNRLVQIVRALADAAGLEKHREHAERAAVLMKADLISDLVQEFPDMQGLAGSYYAQAQKEPDAVAQAIAEQYLPSAADDSLPKTPAGALISLADKLDALIGLFAVGQIPKGDRDPFALRRAATGIWQICALFPLNLSLSQLLDTAAAVYAEQGIEVNDETRTTISEFMLDRLRGWYENQGIHVLVVRAVMACEPPTPRNAHSRICALAELVESPAIKDLAEANKRIANILPTSVENEVNEDLLVLDAEKNLWRETQQREKRVAESMQQPDAEQALQILTELHPAVMAFFEDVLVMDKDANLQKNRLALLKKTRELFLTVADLGVLTL